MPKTGGSASQLRNGVSTPPVPGTTNGLGALRPQVPLMSTTEMRSALAPYGLASVVPAFATTSMDDGEPASTTIVEPRRARAVTATYPAI